MRDISETVDNGVRVRVAPDKRTRVLHDGEETRQVVDFAIGVSSIHDTREIEEMRALVQLGPQSLLEPLLGILERLGLSEQVEMGQDAKHVSRHTRGGEDVEELHSLHLEAVVSVNHEKDNVGHLGDVDHGLELVGAFDKGQALLLGSDDGNGALRVGYRLLGVSSDKRLEESRLAYAGRTDDGDEARRGLIGQSVDEGNMEALFLDLFVVVSITYHQSSLRNVVLHPAISLLVVEACPG
jgi:hypothetical protein